MRLPPATITNRRQPWRWVKARRLISRIAHMLAYLAHARRAVPMNPFIAFKAVAVLAAAVILGVSVALPSSSGVTLKRIHDPRRVTYSIHLRSCHARQGGQLPDRSCTPCSVDPA